MTSCTLPSTVNGDRAKERVVRQADFDHKGHGSQLNLPQLPSKICQPYGSLHTVNMKPLKEDLFKKTIILQHLVGVDIIAIFLSI